MSGAISIRVAGPQDEVRWDAYVAVRGTFFHRFGWSQVVALTYGHRPIYLLAERGGEICGVLPLIDRGSIFFGRALISVGFTVGGGIVGDDENVRVLLAQAAVDEAAKVGAEYVELRSFDQRLDGWHEKHDIYDNFSTAIDPDPDKRLKAIPRKKRADIRKGIAAAEAGNILARSTDNSNEFWEFYGRAQRDHGTPMFPRSWLKNQFTIFGDAMEINVVEVDGRPLAGVVNYYAGDTVHLYNAFISVDARKHHAGDYLYWWMMGHAHDRGATVLDFGRSKRGTGSHAYKTFWGFSPEPMVYLYKLMKTDEMPNVNPQNPKFVLMTKAWQKLPVPVANRLGPFLAGHLA